MGTAKDELADDTAAYFNDMARRYISLAQREEHQAQSELFATIAADYTELAIAAGAQPHSMIEPEEPGSFARWITRVGRWRRQTAPLAAAPLAAPLAVASGVSWREIGAATAATGDIARRRPGS